MVRIICPRAEGDSRGWRQRSGVPAARGSRSDKSGKRTGAGEADLHRWRYGGAVLFACRDARGESRVDEKEHGVSHVRLEDRPRFGDVEHGIGQSVRR